MRSDGADGRFDRGSIEVKRCDGRVLLSREQRREDGGLGHCPAPCWPRRTSAGFNALFTSSQSPLTFKEELLLFTSGEFKKDPLKKKKAALLRAE